MGRRVGDRRIKLGKEYDKQTDKTHDERGNENERDKRMTGKMMMKRWLERERERKKRLESKRLTSDSNKTSVECETVYFCNTLNGRIIEINTLSTLINC